MAAPSGAAASTADLAFGSWEALQISGTPPSPRYVTANTFNILLICTFSTHDLARGMRLKFHTIT